MNLLPLDRRREWTGYHWLVLAVVLAAAAPSSATDPCPFTCGDVNGDAIVDWADFEDFASCMGQLPGSSQECSCSDLDGSGTVDLHDFALFSVLFGEASDEVPPDCTGALGATADLTAFRPQRGAGYAPFARTAVSEDDEESETLGPGIRINEPGDADPAGEDDLIEVQLTVDPPGAPLALRRSAVTLAVWTTRDKQPGTEIAFVVDKSDALPIGPSQDQLIVWVEWASATHGVAELHVEPLVASVPKDTLVLHTFHTIVVALGGENQIPSDPPDPESGTFVVAQELYQQGFDVHMFDEDNVGADGSGIVFDEIANAIQNRGVDDVAIFGYSHGGGSTYDLADLLDISRPTLGVFEIQFTSYVDAVSNDSDIDMGQELRRPPSSAYHLNHYQHGVFFEDLGLDGGPVPDSNPPPLGLDVETTPWGADCTHFEVDDFLQVRDLIDASLQSTITQP
jgi:hypothetical protein